MKQCPCCKNGLKYNQNICPECGYRFFDLRNNFDKIEDDDFKHYHQYEKNEASYSKIVLTRIQLRLMNTISFVFPPLGFVFYFMFSGNNNFQAGFFMLWSILGVLIYLGVSLI